MAEVWRDGGWVLKAEPRKALVRYLDTLDLSAPFLAPQEEDRADSAVENKKREIVGPSMKDSKMLLL